ncbi:hypothetical protein M422DRAFT_64311 [Sphaerobolus stellatus SS14]|nr:hypothetical protein M422DRAFT_64311 [Sphaerobolus stellatus SS14]
MPSILSKFTRSASTNTSQAELQAPSSDSAHRRAHTSSDVSTSSTPRLTSASNPRVVLTSDSSDSIPRSVTTAGSPHRKDSMPLQASNPSTPPQRARTVSNVSGVSDTERSRAQKAFAERMKDNEWASSVSVSNNLPRVEVQGPDLDDLTPGPRRASQSSQPSSSYTNRNPPPVPTRDLPPPPPSAQEPAAQPETTTVVPQPLVSSPTAATFVPGSPPRSTNTNTNAKDTSSPSNEKKKSTSTWQRRTSLSSRSNTAGSKSPPRRIHPSGGLASALAGSGLALANPVMQQAIPMPVVPAPTTQTRHRNNSSTSEFGLPAPREGRDRHSQSRKLSMSHHNHSDDSRENSLRGSSSSGSEENDEDDDDDDSSQDELDALADGVMPITGFAVASNKRTADFHVMFPTVPEGDYLIDDYGCALQREILIQGRLYISENHICFHANIFGWTTDLVIPIEDITSLEKKMTAYVIPNAIQVNTYSAKYTFASLLSRDTTYDVIYNIWRSVHPEGLPSPRGSLDDGGSGLISSMGSVVEGGVPVNGGNVAPSPGARKPTQCTCGKEGKHYSEVAMDMVIPGEPEKIYNLMFASGFIKEFMRNDEKLIDVQISDWTPIAEGSKLLKRNMSYIKPLSGSIGPKQTKCELQDEMIYLDMDDYISMLTTTRTPDVPSGGVFAVKTRTCLTWASAASTRVLVTTQVEWTGRSFIKGIIEKSCLDGQKTYHASLERAMRKYINEHKSEFVPQGFVAEEVEVPNAPPPLSPGGAVSEEDVRKAKEKERNARGLQWAWDTAEGTAKVAQQSFWGAIELIRDAWDASETSAILWFVVVGLVLSNVWTWLRVGKSIVKGPKVRPVNVGTGKVGVGMGEQDVEKVVGQSVKEAFRVFEEVIKGELAQKQAQGALEGEVRELTEKLKGLEERLAKMEKRVGEGQASLQELD